MLRAGINKFWLTLCKQIQHHVLFVADPENCKNHNCCSYPLHRTDDPVIDNIIEKDGRKGEEELTNGRNNGPYPDQTKIIKEYSPRSCCNSNNEKKQPIGGRNVRKSVLKFAR